MFIEPPVYPTILAQAKGSVFVAKSLKYNIAPLCTQNMVPLSWFIDYMYIILYVKMLEYYALTFILGSALA